MVRRESHKLKYNKFDGATNSTDTPCVSWAQLGGWNRVDRLAVSKGGSGKRYDRATS